MPLDSPQNAGLEISTGVCRIISGISPWQGADAVAAQLVSALSDALSTRPIVLVWQSPALNQTHVCWKEKQSGDSPGRSAEPRSTILTGRRIPEELDLPGQLSPEEFQWYGYSTMPGPSSDVEEAWFGTPASNSPALPADLRIVSEQIFRWALHYDQQLLKEKLASLAEFAAAAGHEINNPLGSIIGRASLLLKGEADPEKRRLIESIGAQAYRIGDMIGDTMLFANPPAMQRRTVNINQLIRNVLLKFQGELLESTIQQTITDGSIATIEADERHLSIVLAELIRNSIRSLQNRPVSTGRSLGVRSQLENRHIQPGVRIEVIDNGPGMSAAEQRHCFDPFYSGRQAGRGLGFGLSKSWRIVQQHGGHLSFETSPEETRFICWMPLKGE